VITSASAAGAIEGQAFSGYTVTATGSPTSFAASGLPAGMSIHAATGVLSGTPAHSGIYPVNVSVTNELTTVSSTLTITVAPPAWADWVVDNFTVGERANLLVVGPADDPDGDGAPNLLEYYQDRSPKLYDGPAAEIALTGGYLEMTYERRRGLEAGLFQVEVSSNLVTWESGPAHTETLVIISIDTRMEVVRERSLTPIAARSKHFIRLKVHE
jgi:hypothetical protein